jgi:hypothetical protein
MSSTFLQRVGTFFNLVGLTLSLIFIGSVIGKHVQGIYLLLSITALIVGFLFRRNKAAKESGRFGMLRRMNERKAQRLGEARNNRRMGGRRRPAPTTGNGNEEENNENEE